MADREIYRTTLQRALVVAGGPRTLSVRMGVSREQLFRWLTGEEPISTGAFLEAVDIVENGRPPLSDAAIRF